MTSELFRPQFTPQIQKVINRLYAETIELDPGSHERASANGLNNENNSGFYEAMIDARLPVTPEFGNLLYIMARSSGARNIIEFGTSFGVSTIYLAAAIKDNGGGKIITTELFAAKAEQARANLIEAGLSDYVEIRIGDALQSLKDIGTAPIDLILLDAVKSLYYDVLQVLEPYLRKGGLVISDRASLDEELGAHAEKYLEYISNPENGYRLSSICTQAIGQTFPHDIAIRY